MSLIWGYIGTSQLNISLNVQVYVVYLTHFMTYCIHAQCYNNMYDMCMA